jgi:predicted ester cyclase
MTPDTARTIVAPFYDALTQSATKDVAGIIGAICHADWRSFAGETTSKWRGKFIAQVAGFGKVIPDLAWNIKEALVDGDRIVVRSEASGTPISELFGVPPGGKSFRIMTIDIHTVKDGKLAVAYHVEDWAGAPRQLKAS